MRIGALGLAGRRAIEPGLAADALLHHRESEIIGLVARRPHELGRPEFGDILAEIIAHAFPLPDEADLVPLLEVRRAPQLHRSEEHTSELQSLMRTSYAVFCLKKKMNINN